MKQHLLVVDDEKGSRESLRAIFSERYDVSLAESGEAALRVLKDKRVDLVLLDIIMPRQDGLSFLEQMQSLYPDVPVIMVSASHAVRSVVQAMRLGACDYVSKPFDVDDIQQTVQRALDNAALQRRVATLETDVAREFPTHDIVGQSPAFRAALDAVRKAAATDSTVLILGESGTGKELVARLLHHVSHRRDEPFVAVHCGALPESLMESELFGHEKGAFTGADKTKPGRFDLAANGTLFLDEVSEMSPATQMKLLRVLQEREFMRVGGTRVLRTRARIVAASAKDLRREVEQNRFRGDLYYRLSVVPVTLPPLRERRDDIPILAQRFLDHYRAVLHARTQSWEPRTLDLMTRYAWPGNVRELRNLVERMLVLHGDQEVIRPEFLPDEFRASSPAPASPDDAGTLEEKVARFEKALIERALREAGGIQTRAARLLGTTRRILRYRMEKLNIPLRAPADPDADDGEDNPPSEEPPKP